MVMGKGEARRTLGVGSCPRSCRHRDSALCSAGHGVGWREVGEGPEQQLGCPWGGGGGDIPVFDEILVEEGVTPGRRWVSKGLDREGRSERSEGRECPLATREFLHRMGEVGRAPGAPPAPWSTLVRVVPRWVWDLPREERRLQDCSEQADLCHCTGPCSPQDRAEGGQRTRHRQGMGTPRGKQELCRAQVPQQPCPTTPGCAGPSLPSPAVPDTSLPCHRGSSPLPTQHCPASSPPSLPSVPSLSHL